MWCTPFFKNYCREYLQALLFTRQKLTMTFSPDISPPVFQAISTPFDSQQLLFRPYIAVAKEVQCILRASIVNVQCSKFTAPHDTTTTIE